MTPPDDVRSFPNLPLPTFGGAQVWADVHWRAGWRIQQQTLTSHHRLLDPSNFRRAWGSYAACRAALDATVPAQNLAPPDGRPLVILLHGMGRTRVSFGRMRTALEAAGWRCARLSYPTTRRSIEEHSAWLETVLAHIIEDGSATSVCFVTHSLGGIVVRSTLARNGAWRAALPVGRVVMLGPPNQGSALAERMSGWKLFQWLYGATGQGLAPEGVRALPPPDVPFLVIAGARGDGRGWNPWLPGDDDGVVALSETFLPGAADHHTVRSIHTFLAAHSAAIAHTLDFLDG